jgi:hypothetical protein
MLIFLGEGNGEANAEVTYMSLAGIRHSFTNPQAGVPEEI